MIDEKAYFYGELNFIVSDAVKCFKRIKESFLSDAILIEELDGLSMTFANWRFNLRKSNTEPLVRLNIETRCDQSLLIQKTKELKALIDGDMI